MGSAGATGLENWTEIRREYTKEWMRSGWRPQILGERRVNEDGGREGKECAVDLRVATF